MKSSYQKLLNFFLKLTFPLGKYQFYSPRRRLFRSNEELVYYPPIDTLYWVNILWIEIEVFHSSPNTSHLTQIDNCHTIWASLLSPAPVLHQVLISGIVLLLLNLSSVLSPARTAGGSLAELSIISALNFPWRRRRTARRCEVKQSSYLAAQVRWGEIIAVLPPVKQPSILGWDLENSQITLQSSPVIVHFSCCFPQFEVFLIRIDISLLARVGASY